MKILQLISSYGFFGAENVVLQLTKELTSRGVSTALGVFNNSQNPHTEVAKEALQNNLSAIVFDCNGRLDAKTISRINAFIRKETIDIVHSHGYKSNIYAYLASKGTAANLVSTCHNWIAKDRRTRLYYLLDRIILKRYDGVVAVSEAIEDQLKAIGIKEDKRCCIRNGINIEPFKNGKSLRAQFDLKDNDIVIGTIGRLSSEKGLIDLLKLARRTRQKHNHIIFLIVGDGPLRDELFNLRGKYELLDGVVFAGQRDDMPDVYKTIDIFLLPSHNEGLPMVILEAMASRVPIIASRVGGIPSVIDNNQSGILVEPGNIDGFYNGIHALLGNQGMAKKLADNAFRKILLGFSSERMCLRYLETYRNILN